MISTYEELRRIVEERRSDTLTLEVELGVDYTQEWVDAKQELEQARAMDLLKGASFLSSSVKALEEKVQALAPTVEVVWLRYGRVPLLLWASLAKEQGGKAIEQYERVLKDTFIGLYGDADCTVLITDDYHVVSQDSPNCILMPGTLMSVIRTFMDWQNSGGRVSIRPTKSGQD